MHDLDAIIIGLMQAQDWFPEAPHPMNQDELGGCVHCGGTPPGSSYGYATKDPKHHASDCAWVQAYNYLKEQGYFQE